MMSKKRITILALAVMLAVSTVGFAPACAKQALAEEDAGAKPEEGTDYAVLLADMARAYEDPSPESVQKIDADVEALDDPFAAAVARRWKQVYVDRDYRLLIFGEDDPHEIPVTGKHAFVVLGFALKNGEMTDELKGRCNAAAAAARAFPDSLLICTGGATGENNPKRHTEAGLMKEYLSQVCGIDPARILTEELARNTTENATNVLAMLRELQIESLTVITSDYHQRRGQTLYAAAAARYNQEQGYEVEVVGNFSYAAHNNGDSDYKTAIYQLRDIMGLSDEESGRLYEMLKR